MTSADILLGAVAYDPKAVTIWEGFRRWLVRHDLRFDYVLYSNYERQVEDLIRSRIDVAWNSPLAWVRAQRLAQAAGISVRPLAMRDTDRDLRSVLVVRAASPISGVNGIKGARVGTGAIDSPQGTLLPLGLLLEHGVREDQDFELSRFDVGVGLHGDHIGGEREAARALMAGAVDVACMTDGNHLLFSQEGILPSGSTRIIAETPPYDHCNLTVRDGSSDALDQLATLLLGMDISDPEVRHLFDLEGLTQWVPGRDEGYEQLRQAVDSLGFYDSRGTLTNSDYRP